tara:strand:- start:1211 stop:1417 length:207 start_codon:yes stop_codon:yes gene_type:complete
MDTIGMENIVSGMQQLHLPTITPMDYRGAEEFARQFKKCSALEEHNVTYSASTCKKSMDSKNSNIGSW